MYTVHIYVHMYIYIYVQSLHTIIKGPANNKNPAAQIQNFLNTYLKGANTYVIKTPEISDLPKLLRIRIQILVKLLKELGISLIFEVFLIF